MALMHRALPLPIHAPTPPDRFFCHPSHSPLTNIRIVPAGCQLAVNTFWPDGRTPLRYFLKDPRPSQGESIPRHVESATCRVSIEAAGPPEHLPHSVLLSPHELRGLAGFVIQKCAVENEGMGGFVTVGLGGALAYVHNPGNGHWGGNLLTISIQPQERRGGDVTEPGSRDGNVAALLSAYAAGFVPDREYLPHNTWYYYAVSEILRKRALEIGVTYNPDLTWWSKGGVWEWWAKRYNHSLHLWTPGSDGPRPTTPMPPEWEDPWSDGSTSNTSSSSSSSGGYGSPGGDERGGEGQGGGADAGSATKEGLEEQGQGDAYQNDSSSQTDVEEGDSDSQRTITDPGDMTYQCDGILGNGLNPIDCEKLSWSGLKPPDSIEILQPGVPIFFSQGTCALGISSLTPTTIIWSHLLAAFDALNMLCVQNPIKKTKGGRAYFGKQSVDSWINGRVRRDGIDEQINGTGALPPGINATLFKHNSKSQLACEWALVQEGKDVSSCENG